MNVVLIGSAKVDVNAIARALGRVLDAMVVDGDRIPGGRAISDDEDWVRALADMLARPSRQRRPHLVATRTSPSSSLRQMLPASEFRLVAVHDDSEPPPTDPGEDVIVIPVGRDVEAVATRLASCLMRP